MTLRFKVHPISIYFFVCNLQYALAPSVQKPFVSHHAVNILSKQLLHILWSAQQISRGCKRLSVSTL